MSETARLPIKTAFGKQSIWFGLDENQFRTHVVALEQKSNEVPEDPKDHSLQDWERIHDRPGHCLPLIIEQRIADDVAFIAAAEEGALAVAAASLEELVNGEGLRLRLAMNAGVPMKTRKVLRSIFDTLATRATGQLPALEATEILLSYTINLCKERIHSRLGSAHRRRPSYPGRRADNSVEPLHQALRKLSDSHRAFLSKYSARSRIFLQDLDDLCSSYKAIDDPSGNEEERHTKLKQALRRSHALSTSNGAGTLETTIADCGLNPRRICRDKPIRQVCKLGRYWGFCLDTPKHARKYRKLFRATTIEYLLPYKPSRSTISYPERSSVNCHVHAEIQLLIHNDNPSNRSVEYRGPRVFGVSKSACYLCNLFILRHGDLFISKTHGRLYDQWALPDLAEYTSQQRQKYRGILKAMDAEMQSATQKQPLRNRQYPLGSWISLPTPAPASSTTSESGTVLSGPPGSHPTPTQTATATAPILPPNLPGASGSMLPSSPPTAGNSAQGSPRPHDDPSPSIRHSSPPLPSPQAAPHAVPPSPSPPAPDPPPPPTALSLQLHSASTPQPSSSPLRFPTPFLPSPCSPKPPSIAVANQKPLLPPQPPPSPLQPPTASPSPAAFSDPRSSAAENKGQLPPRQHPPLPPALEHSPLNPPPQIHPAPNTPPSHSLPSTPRPPSPLLPTPPSPPPLLPSPPPPPPPTPSSPSSSSSTSSSLSPTTPYLLTPTSLLHLSLPHLSTTFEIEPPARAHIRVLGPPQQTSKTELIIDIDALIPNEPRTFARDQAEGEMLLVLRKGEGRVMLGLEWL